MKHELRQLVPGDEAALEMFLQGHPDSSMYLRSNLRRAGLVDGGAAYQGTYVAALDGRAIVGVAAHYWNDMIVVQAPHDVAALVPRLAALSGRDVAGLLGPGEQVTRARSALGLADREASEAGVDDLFALDLAALKVPAPLAEDRVAVRQPLASEIPLITEWSVSFNREAVGFAESAELRRSCADHIARLQKEGAHFVLVSAGVPVAYAAFNATVPDAMQLGGVWTPPGQRGRGYAHNVVAGALLSARSNGVKRGVLFTDADNHAAQAVYRDLGFTRIGDYGIVIFA